MTAMGAEQTVVQVLDFRSPPVPAVRLNRGQWHIPTQVCDWAAAEQFPKQTFAVCFTARVVPMREPA